MQVKVLSGRELDARARERWCELQRGSPSRQSPFFAPGYVESIAAARDDVFVAQISRGGEIQGFLPFQRTGPWARPVGGPLTDLQGLVGTLPPGKRLSDVLACCGLGAWSYDQLILDRTAPVALHDVVAESPYLDLSAGFPSYVAARRAAGSKQIVQIQRKTRKLEREVGPLRFEWDVRDAARLDQLFEWKSRQYARIGSRDRFGYRWIRDVVREVFARRDPECSGLLSALWAGGQLVALHMGMRSRSVLHYWFPSYDATFGRYSPGSILLLNLAQRAADENIAQLDLGVGDERYKDSMASGAVRVAAGVALASNFRGRLLDCYGGIRRRVRDWSFLSPLKRLTRDQRARARFR